MALYRFVGAYSVCEELPQKSLASFGQQIDIDDELAKACIAHRNIDLVPESVWQEAGVTPEEAKKHADSKQHANAPDDFRAKKATLLKAAQEHRAELKAAIAKGDQ